MSGERFAEPSLDPLFRRRQPGDVGHELDQRVEPRIPGAPASSNGTLSGEGDRDRMSAAPVSSSPSHHGRSIAAGFRIGSLPYLVLVALVAVGITGAFFGSGFLLLRQPAKVTGVGSNAHEESPSATPKPLASNSVVTPTPPAPLAEQSAAVPEATPRPSAVPPNAEPPASTAANPQPPAAVQAFSAPATVPPHRVNGRPATEGKRHHSRTASRHMHLRSAPQQAQQSFFDQLLTRLTGQMSSPATLTPPKGQ